MSNGLSIIFTCFYALFDIVFMKHNVVYVFVILVDDVYCVAIHDLSPVLTALFSFGLGGFNSQHISLMEVVAVSQHKFEEVDKSLDVGDDGLLC